MSTHNKHFHGEIRKSLFGYPRLSGAMIYCIIHDSVRQLWPKTVPLQADLGLWCPTIAIRTLFLCYSSNRINSSVVGSFSVSFLAHGELLRSVNVRRVSSTIALKDYSSYTPEPIYSILGRKYRGDL